MEGLEIGGTQIEPTSSHKFLGVHFDSKLLWREHRAKVLKSASNWAQLIGRVSKLKHGLKPQTARKLYESVFLPKITYAADIWWTATREEASSDRRTGAVGFIKRLQSTQRSIAICISGALHTSPTDSLLSHAGIPPIELELRKATHRAAVRLAGTPTHHPLHPVVKRESSKQIFHHKSSLQILFETTGVEASRFAPRPKSTLLPDSTKLLNATIEADKETAIADERSRDPTVKIFTDGSMVDGKVGAAAVLIRNGREDRVAKLHLGSDREHEVYEAEVVGLILGMELLAGERNVWAADIYIDNQAVLRTLEKGRTNNLGHLYAHLDKAIKTVRKKIPGARIDTRWIPGHADVAGNEMADRAAKEAARETNLANNFTSRYLRDPIPINPMAAKRTRKEHIPEEWRKWVGETEGVQNQRQIDRTFPSRSFSVQAAELPREQYTILTQLRIGHFPLADYLNRFKLIDSRICRLCNWYPETVQHILMSCPMLSQLRVERDYALGVASRSFRVLLQPGKGTKHLIDYIQTARNQIGALANRTAEERGLGGEGRG